MSSTSLSLLTSKTGVAGVVIIAVFVETTPQILPEKRRQRKNSSYKKWKPYL